MTLRDLAPAELKVLLRRGIEHKARKDPGPKSLSGRVLAMVFEKSSTRTRVSFEAAMAQLGGTAIFLSTQDTQLGRGEPLEDMARVLSRMVDGIVVRTHGHDRLMHFAAEASIPVINGLTDRHHPCQLLADMQTYVEHRGPIAGRRVAWLGDGNNVCCSYIEAAALYGFTLHLCCPAGFFPPPDVIAGGGRAVRCYDRPEEAVRGVQLVVTDVWASMGQEAEAEARRSVFHPYQVNEALMAEADPEALFMHCLPAHRGEEVSAGVLDGAKSVVWDEAGNRLHAQKALLELLLQ